MALKRGRFGIEYTPAPTQGGASGLGWTVAVLLVAVAVSLTVALVRRFRSAGETEEMLPLPPEPAETVTKPDARPPLPTPVGFAEVWDTLATRTGAVRTHLLSLREAQEKGDLLKEVATINQLRAMPGNSALDLNNLLARRLGELNVTWLFERHNPQWVKKVQVRSGDSASRIAQDHGSTLESFRKLNADKDVNRLRVGEEVLVMDHPRFYLCVYPNTRKADLQLRGQFFKRYDLREAVSGEPGTFEPTGNLRKFLAEHGVWFQLADRQELELLLPKKFTFVIGDL